MLEEPGMDLIGKFYPDSKEIIELGDEVLVHSGIEWAPGCWEFAFNFILDLSNINDLYHADHFKLLRKKPMK